MAAAFPTTAGPPNSDLNPNGQYGQAVQQPHASYYQQPAHAAPAQAPGAAGQDARGWGSEWSYMNPPAVGGIGNHEGSAFNPYQQQQYYQYDQAYWQQHGYNQYYQQQQPGYPEQPPAVPVPSSSEHASVSQVYTYPSTTAPIAYVSSSGQQYHQVYSAAQSQAYQHSDAHVHPQAEPVATLGPQDAAVSAASVPAPEALPLEPPLQPQPPPVAEWGWGDEDEGTVAAMFGRGDSSHDSTPHPPPADIVMTTYDSGVAKVTSSDDPDDPSVAGPPRPPDIVPVAVGVQPDLVAIPNAAPQWDWPPADTASATGGPELLDDVALADPPVPAPEPEHAPLPSSVVQRVVDIGSHVMASTFFNKTTPDDPAQDPGDLGAAPPALSVGAVHVEQQDGSVPSDSKHPTIGVMQNVPPLRQEEAAESVADHSAADQPGQIGLPSDLISEEVDLPQRVEAVATSHVDMVDPAHRLPEFIDELQPPSAPVDVPIMREKQSGVTQNPKLGFTEVSSFSYEEGPSPPSSNRQSMTEVEFVPPAQSLNFDPENALRQSQSDSPRPSPAPAVQPPVGVVQPTFKTSADIVYDHRGAVSTEVSRANGPTSAQASLSVAPTEHVNIEQHFVGLPEPEPQPEETSATFNQTGLEAGFSTVTSQPPRAEFNACLDGLSMTLADAFTVQEPHRHMVTLMPYPPPEPQPDPHASQPGGGVVQNGLPDSANFNAGLQTIAEGSDAVVEGRSPVTLYEPPIERQRQESATASIPSIRQDGPICSTDMNITDTESLASRTSPTTRHAKKLLKDDDVKKFKETERKYKSRLEQLTRHRGSRTASPAIPQAPSVSLWAGSIMPTQPVTVITADMPRQELDSVQSTPQPSPARDSPQKRPPGSKVISTPKDSDSPDALRTVDAKRSPAPDQEPRVSTPDLSAIRPPEVTKITSPKGAERLDEREKEKEKPLPGILRSSSYAGANMANSYRRDRDRRYDQADGDTEEEAYGSDRNREPRRRPTSRGSAYSDYHYYRQQRYQDPRYRPQSAKLRPSTRSNGGFYDQYDDDEDFEDYSDLEFDRYSDYGDVRAYAAQAHWRAHAAGYEQRDPWREWFDRWYVQRYGHFPTYEQYRSWRYHHLTKSGKQKKEKERQAPTGSVEKESDRSFEIASETSDSEVGRVQKKESSAPPESVKDTSTREIREPAKHGHFHALATFGLGGNLAILSKGDYRRGGYSSAPTKPIEFRRLKALITDPTEVAIIDCIESFPGPLQRPTTHKGALIQFCQKRAHAQAHNAMLADSESAALIWQLLTLLLRQNCAVQGSDLAQLLLGQFENSLEQDDSAIIDREPFYYSDEDFEHVDRYPYNRSLVNTGSQCDNLAVGQFTSLLLSGNRRDALECAMRNDLWGHALFLAINIDDRTHASVITRFANSLSLNSPLQTLYQLLSGRQPFAATKSPDDAWGSWRPHLAMILANFDPANPVHLQSVLTMGNTLLAAGRNHAAHFCYLAAQLLTWYDIFAGGLVGMVGAQLGSSQRILQDLEDFENFQATEIYEYCISLLAPGYLIPSLQLQKFIYACRLVDYSLAEEAYGYFQVLGSYMNANPAGFTRALMHGVYAHGLRLSHFDPSVINEPLGGPVPVIPGWLNHCEKTLSCKER